MASIIRATTTNGLQVAPDNSGSLVLQTNGTTTALTIDTSQNATFAGTVAMSSSFLRNRIINGDMRIDQRNAGASVTLTSSAPYTVDRWLGLEDTDGGMTAQQDSSAPTGFNNSLKFTTTSADSSLSAAQTCRMQQHIEGFNIADLGWGTANAKTVTLSFWVRSSLTGTFAGGLRNYDANRGYPFNYTISAANTWEYKTVTVTGDTTGTWNTTNSGGIAVIFDLGSGSNYQSTVNTWGAGNYFSTSGATSVIGTNGATWYITGVQLEVGSTATPFERRMYGQELALCQRYFTLIASGDLKSTGVGYYYSATSAYGNFNLPVTMRTTPTIYQTTGTDYYRLYRNSNNDGVNSFTVGDGTTPQSLEFLNSSEASGTAGQAGFWRTGNASSYLAVQAEL
jgi:hypothetical protein